MDQLPQMSDATRQALKHPFLLEHRGVIEVKGKGEMSTWFLNNGSLNWSMNPRPRDACRDTISKLWSVNRLLFNTLTSIKSIQYLYNPKIFSKILELCVKLSWFNF